MIILQIKDGFAYILYDCAIVARHLQDSHEIFEPPRGKTNNVVSEQVPHKPACTSTEKS